MVRMLLFRITQAAEEGLFEFLEDYYNGDKVDGEYSAWNAFVLAWRIEIVQCESVFDGLVLAEGAIDEWSSRLQDIDPSKFALDMSHQLTDLIYR